MAVTKMNDVALISAGVILAVALRYTLNAYASLAIPDPSVHSVPIWYGLSRPLLTTVAQIAPAFLVGWFSRQSGFLVGALVGAFSSLAISLLIETRWQSHPFSPFNWFLLWDLIFWAIAAAVSASVAGAAGELARSRLRST